MSGTFWVGADSNIPSTSTRRKGLAIDMDNEAHHEIIKALGKDPFKQNEGSLPAPIATGRLRKFDFSDHTLPYAADVLRIAKMAGRGPGAVLRWL
jgi:hypothetical protein